jgi:cell surface protein SprA
VRQVFAQTVDTLRKANDSLRFPIHDRRGDFLACRNRNPFDLNDTSFIKQKVEYDPKTNQYYILEKVVNTYFRKPTALTFEEYYKLRTQQQQDDYFKQRTDALTLLNKKVQRPPVLVYNTLYDRIFGVGPDGLKVLIKPQGSVDIQMEYNGQNSLNPTLPEAARRTGGFDFNLITNLNVNANIGNKLKLPINYNTLANFNYLNQSKLNYKGMNDEIIRSIEAGNIAFQTKGALMSSAQNLFGTKT